MRILAAAPAALGLAASAGHSRFRTMPNWFGYAVPLFGIAWYGATEGLLGFGSLWMAPLLGCIVAHAVYLSAAAGTQIGSGLVVQASIRTALPGGIGAVESVHRSAWRSRTWGSGTSQGEFIRYASSIVGGVWRTLWAK